MNLAENLVQAARQSPGSTAIRLDREQVTYAELDHLTQLVAGLLTAKGVRPGDRVGVMLPNVPQFAWLYYGVLRAGAVVVPMNPLLKQREVAHCLGDSEARLVFAWPTCAAEAEAGAREAGTETVVMEPSEFLGTAKARTQHTRVEPRAGADTAVILYTSGTTGRPKGAELTHANLSSCVDTAADTLLSAGPDDVIFGGLPLFHVFGQTFGLNLAVRAGALLTLLPRFDPGMALDVLARDKVTIFEGVPTMYSALLHAPGCADYDVSALRVAVTGGAAMPVEVLHGFEKTFGCTVLEGYGLTETSPTASFNHPGAEHRPGSVGTPVRGVEMRVVDDSGKTVPTGEVGEIVVRGENVMKGYWGNPAETAKAIRGGWFHTGDLGRQDSDGYFYVVDRKKDVIIRGGYNVYPREIEEVLYEHPAVAEAAVVGVPHPELGEEIAAAVTLKPAAQTAPGELREFVKDKVAAYKYPRLVEIFASLPKGPTGKILKREIRLGPER
ncbi:long-chain-fatty-acid--CoA ligase [Kibdelosporangium aridum]|uniref:long-chain-fatty-acid--CoA ligase n=1 Tax=Kibdelosporangium aridum TaxID=2030 RepID=UPI00052587AF